MPPSITTVHDLMPPHAARTSDDLPLAATLKAEPGWNVLAFEWEAGVPTKRVLFLPVASWGVVLSRRATQTPALSALTEAVLPPVPVEAIVPLSLHGERLTSLRGFLLLSPPGESFTEAIARAEAAEEAVRALLPETPSGIRGERAALVIEDDPLRVETDCPRSTPCTRLGHHFDDECAPAPQAAVEGSADGR